MPDTRVAQFREARASARSHRRADLSMGFLDGTSGGRGQRGYGDAGPSRINGGRFWAAPQGETSIATDLKRTYLVEACREAFRSNPIFRRIINTIVENVVGVGFRIEPQSADPGWNAEAAAIYGESCRRENFSPNETASEWESFVTMCISHKRDGGVLVYRPYGGTQLFEEGQIMTPRSMATDPSVIDGLKFNSAGKLQGFYVGEYSRFGGFLKEGSYTLLPAWHIDTDYQCKLPVTTYIRSLGFASGVRGIPLLAPVLDDLERLGDYIDAMLERAIEEACVMGVLKSDDKDAGGALNVRRTDDAGNATDSTYTTVSRLEPGVVPHLKLNEEFDIKAISTPGGNFDPFVQMLCRFIGAPASMPVELTLLNFADSNFSAARGAIEQFKLACIMDKNLYMEQWSAPNYRWRVYEAMKSGRLTYREDWQQVKVSPSGWKYMQPVEDAQAATERMANGSANLANILAEQGIGLEEHLTQTADVILTARRIADEKGVPVEQLLSSSKDLAAIKASRPPPTMPEPMKPGAKK